MTNQRLYRFDKLRDIDASYLNDFDISYLASFYEQRLQEVDAGADVIWGKYRKDDTSWAAVFEEDRGYHSWARDTCAYWATQFRGEAQRREAQRQREMPGPMPGPRIAGGAGHPEDQADAQLFTEAQQQRFLAKPELLKLMRQVCDSGYRQTVLTLHPDQGGSNAKFQNEFEDLRFVRDALRHLLDQIDGEFADAEEEPF